MTTVNVSGARVLGSREEINANDPFHQLASQLLQAQQAGNMAEVMRLRQQYDQLSVQAGRKPVDWDRKYEFEKRPVGQPGGAPAIRELRSGGVAAQQQGYTRAMPMMSQQPQQTPGGGTLPVRPPGLVGMPMAGGGGGGGNQMWQSPWMQQPPLQNGYMLPRFRRPAQSRGMVPLGR